MQEILTKYNFSFTDLFKLFPQEKALLEEYTRLEKLVKRGLTNFQQPFEATGNKINDLLAKNEERLASMAKAMEKRKNGVPKPQSGEFFTVEVTQDDGTKNKQEKTDIDEATDLFNTCVNADLTVVLKKVSKNGETENAEIIFQHIKGTEPALAEPQPETPQEIIVKDDFAGIKFKNVKFQDAQAFIRFLILAGASRQWLLNSKNYFWFFPPPAAPENQEYIITSKNPFDHSGSAGYLYLMVKNPAAVETLKSLLFDICENHTEPVPVYESDTQDPLLQVTDDIKEPDAAIPEPVSGIPYTAIKEALAFLNNLDFDKFIHLLCIKKLYDENESYRGENFGELITHYLNKKLPVEYFNAKQLLPDKKIILWLERKGFLNENYEPAKVTENIIKLHGYYFSMGNHPFSDITGIAPQPAEVGEIKSLIEYRPCGYLPGINYANGAINCHDDLMGYVVFLSQKNETHIFVSSLEYNSIGEGFPSSFSSQFFKFYISAEGTHLYALSVKDEKNKAFKLKTVSLQKQLFHAYNSFDYGHKKLIPYSDFKNENDILFNYDESKPVSDVPQPAQAITDNLPSEQPIPIN